MYRFLDRCRRRLTRQTKSIRVPSQLRLEELENRTAPASLQPGDFLVCTATHGLQMITAANHVVSTLLGNLDFDTGAGVAVTGDRNLLFTKNNNVIQWNPATGNQVVVVSLPAPKQVTDVFGNTHLVGPVPQDVDVDSSGNIVVVTFWESNGLYVANPGYDLVVWRIDRTSGQVTTSVRIGWGMSPFHSTAVDATGQNVFFLSAGSPTSQLLRIDAQGNSAVVASGLPAFSVFYNDLQVGADGLVYYATTSTVYKIDPSTGGTVSLPLVPYNQTGDFTTGFVTTDFASGRIALSSAGKINFLERVVTIPPSASDPSVLTSAQLSQAKTDGTGKSAIVSVIPAVLAIPTDTVTDFDVVAGAPLPVITSVADLYSSAPGTLGTYVSLVPLQDTFTVTVNNPDSVDHVNWRFSDGSHQGTAKRIGTTNQWSFTLDVGTLVSTTKGLEVNAYVAGQSTPANTYDAPVSVTTTVNVGLQGSATGDGNNFTDVANLRFVRGGVLSEQFNGTLANLPTVYGQMVKSIQFGGQPEAVQASGSGGFKFSYDVSQLPAGNTPILGVTFTGDAFVSAANPPPSFYAIDVPSWMGIPTSNTFGSAPADVFGGTTPAYVLHLQVPSALQPALPTISAFGLFGGLQNSLDVGLDLVVYAKLTTNAGDAVVQAADAHANVTLLNQSFLNWQVNSFASASANLAPKNLDFVDTLTVSASKDFGSKVLLQESFGTTPPWNVKVIFASAGVAELVAGASLTGNLQVTGSLKADMNLQVKLVGTQLAMDPASVVHLQASAKGEGTLTATGQVTLGTLIGAVDLLTLVGTATGELDLAGDLLLYPAASSGLFAGNLTMQLGYSLGYNLAVLPKKFKIDFEGKTDPQKSAPIPIFSASSSADLPPAAEVKIKPQVDVKVIDESPVAPLITDPLGRRLGTDPTTGLAINEIGPNATDTGPNSEPRILTIPSDSVVAGAYAFSGVGTGTGPYRLELQVTEAGNPAHVLLSKTVASGVTVLGQTVPAISPVDVLGTISKAIPTVTVIDAGGNYTGSPFPATSASVLGVGSDGTIASFGDPALSYLYYQNGALLPGAPTDVGTYTVVAHFAGNTNYNSADSAPVTFNVNPAPLTITPTAGQYMAYGTVVPALTYTPSGFVNGDNSAIVVGSLGTTATASSPVGNYPFTLGTLNAGPHYTLQLAANAPTFAVTQPYPIPDQVIPHTQFPVTFNLSPTSTYQVQYAGSQAWFLSHDLSPVYSSYDDFGQREEWFQGVTNKFGNNWYCLTPNGAFLAWDGSQGLESSFSLGTVDPVYWWYPDMLQNASAESLAYALDQYLGLGPDLNLDGSPNYYENYLGRHERWLSWSGGYVFIIPNGGLYNGNGTLLTTLDPIYFSQLARLYDAQVGQFSAQLVSGPALVLNTVNDYVGQWFVEMSTTGGQALPVNTLTVTSVNRVPTLSAIADQTVPTNQNTLTVAVTATDADPGDTVHLAAQAANVGLKVHNDYGLYAVDTTSYYSQGEKWFRGNVNPTTNQSWYYIQPNGQLFAWKANGADVLLTTLDPVYNAFPRLLYQATTVDLAAALRQDYVPGWDDYGGAGNRWLMDAALSTWYYLTPSGQLFQGNGTLISNLGAISYNNLPSGSPPLFTATMSGSNVVASWASGFTGDIWVQVEASDQSPNNGRLAFTLFKITVTA